MKRILSLMAIAALIVSMFSGVVLAAPKECKIIVDTEVLEYEGGVNQITISGRIVYATTESRASVDNKVYIEGLPNSATSADSGRFSITIFDSMLEIGLYEVIGISGDDDDITFIDGDEDYFRLVPEMELSDGDALELDFPVKGAVSIMGIYPNEDGRDYDLEIGYIDDDGLTMKGSDLGTAVSSDTKFSFLIDGEDEFDKSGDIGIFAKPEGAIGKGVLVLKGSVSPEELDVFIVQDSIVKGFEEQTIIFDFNVDNDYTEGDKMEDDFELRFTAYEPGDDDNPVEFEKVLVSSHSKTFDDPDKQRISYDLDTRDWDNGDAIFIVELHDDDNDSVIAEKELELKVVKPSRYTLIGWGLDEVPVGDITIKFPDTNGSFPSGTADQRIEVVEYDDGDTETIGYLEVTFEGTGIDKTYKTFGDKSIADEIVTFTATETGEIDVTIKVYSSETDTSVNKTFRETIKVTGFNVSFKPDTIEVNTDPDFVVYISDENDNPINNAIIRIDDQTIVNGAISSISGGVYVYEDDEKELFRDVGTYDLEIKAHHHGDILTIVFEDAVSVIGEEVYSVASSRDTLVNGTEEEIYITVVDDDGEIVYPEFVRIDVDEDGEKSAPVTLSPKGYKDMNDDGIKDARLEIQPSNDQVAMIIRATTDDGQKMGEITLEVSPPEVEMKEAETATENIKTEFRFKIIDPRDDDDFLDVDVYFLADNQYVDYTLRDEDNDFLDVDDGESDSISADGDDEYNCIIMVNDVDWDKAEEDDVEPFIALYLESGSGDDDDVKLLEIPVKTPQLTSDPSDVIAGTSTSLVFHYADADGRPLSDYEITVDGEEIGETDSRGNAYFTTAAALGATIVVEAETDDNDDDDSEIADPHDDNEDTITTVLRIKPGHDTKGPEITAPKIVNRNTAMITISDSARVDKAVVNGKVVNIVFPMPTVPHVVNLKEGTNKFQVHAIDTNRNISTVDLTIVYDKNYNPNTPVDPVDPVDPVAPVDPVDPTDPAPAGEVTFTIGKATSYGTPLLKNSTTVVPVRFAESLGASFEWDGATKTATYKLGDIVIAVTVGRAYAVVNGENVLMTEPAYLNEQNRTMVPVRMIAKELGYDVNWNGNDKPITITKKDS